MLSLRVTASFETYGRPPHRPLPPYFSREIFPFPYLFFFSAPNLTLLAPSQRAARRGSSGGGGARGGRRGLHVRGGVEEGRPQPRAPQDAHLPDEAAPAHAGHHPHQTHRQLRPPLQVRDRQQGGIAVGSPRPLRHFWSQICVFGRF